MVHVNAYVRADGTRVLAHSRWAAGVRSQMSALAVVVLVVVGFSGTGASSEGRQGKPAPRPTPTVSYPIRWDTSR
ncbi:hypothetical protein [Streptomyces sp. NPDC055400]